MVKNLPQSLGLGRSSGIQNGNPLSILAWKIPWTEESGRLQSRGHRESDTTEHTEHILYCVMYRCESWTIKKAEC